MARPKPTNLKNTDYYAGRYTTLDDKTSAKICDALRHGSTRKAAAGGVRIHASTLRIWMRRGEAINKQIAEAEERGEVYVFQGDDAKYAKFALDVEQAEDECEAECAATLLRAGAPYQSKTTRKSVKTFFKTYKVMVNGVQEERVITRPVTHPDGTVTQEPFEFVETTVSTGNETEFDWKAHESWLKRRRRPDWGDSISQKLVGPDDGPMSEADLLKALNDSNSTATSPDATGV